jgi:hypothetical protein
MQTFFASSIFWYLSSQHLTLYMLMLGGLYRTLLYLSFYACLASLFAFYDMLNWIHAISLLQNDQLNDLVF